MRRQEIISCLARLEEYLQRNIHKAVSLRVKDSIELDMKALNEARIHLQAQIDSGAEE